MRIRLEHSAEGENRLTGESAPEICLKREIAAYESGTRATKAGSHRWGTYSKGDLRSEDTSNNPPENRVVDYGLFLTLYI